MRKVTRNLSLPKIKTNYNSIKANIKTISNTKRSKHIINKNPFNNLLIYIRFSPLFDKEKEITSNEIVNIPDNNTIILKKIINIYLIMFLIKLWNIIHFSKKG